MHIMLVFVPVDTNESYRLQIHLKGSTRKAFEFLPSFLFILEALVFLVLSSSSSLIVLLEAMLFLTFSSI
jgi:hypothetical protein